MASISRAIGSVSCWDACTQVHPLLAAVPTLALCSIPKGTLLDESFANRVMGVDSEVAERMSCSAKIGA